MEKVKWNNYNNALVEVEVVLNHLSEKDYEKVPINIINAITKNKNPNYKYEYDENLDFEYWTMLPETKAILFNLYRDYLATPEQKSSIIRNQSLERIKLNEEKIKKYNPDNIFKNREDIQIDNNQNSNKKSERNLVVYEENILKRFINRISKLFNKD